jgi:CRISPR/Cas system CMR-associated protein Cmr1 (group 7 of RAMP superfamily)
MLKFGSTSQKVEAMKEIQKVAFGDQNRESSEILNSDDKDDQSSSSLE